MLYRLGPQVIKLSRVRTHNPNRTPCSKSYSYSRSRGNKTFCTRIHTQVEYKSVISRVSSITSLEPYSKLFLCEISFPTKSIGQNFQTNDFNSTSVSPHIICLYAFAFFWRIRMGGVQCIPSIYMYINYINSTRTCTLVYNTQTYALRDNN